MEEKKGRGVDICRDRLVDGGREMREGRWEEREVKIRKCTLRQVEREEGVGGRDGKREGERGRCM